jgi:hypothetical protein
MIASLSMSVAVANEAAQEKGKGKKQQAALSIVDQFLKALEPAELKDDQKEAIKSMMAEVQKDVVAKREAAGIKAEVLRKRAAARKEGSDAGKKGAELKQHVEAALGLSADQLKVLDETEKALSKAKLEAGKKLTADQIAKLPEQVRRSVQAPAGKEGGKKAKGEGDK